MINLERPHVSFNYMLLGLSSFKLRITIRTGSDAKRVFLFRLLNLATLFINHQQETINSLFF